MPRSAFCIARRRGGARGGRSGRSAIAHAARLAHACTVGPRLSRPLQWRARRTRWRLSSMNGVAVAAWAVRRGLVARARQFTRCAPGGPDTISRSATHASRSRRSRSHFRNSRRRRAACSRGHTVSGVVAWRTAADGASACRVGSHRRLNRATMCVSPPSPTQGRCHATAARCQSVRYH